MAASLQGHSVSVHGQFPFHPKCTQVIEPKCRLLALPCSPVQQQLFISSRHGHGNPRPGVGLSRQSVKSQVNTSSAQVNKPDNQQENAAPKERAQLYPLSDVITEGYMPASSGHSIYYQVRGNPDGYPALCVHGGPGAGAYPKHSCFFDPAFYRIILFDQRGCGRSTPRGSLADNTTWHLVDDMERLRLLLGVDRWLLFGGSWGVTLSLAYAQTHPERVSGCVLRGVCLMRPRDLEWFAGTAEGEPAGAAQLLPFSYARFSAGFNPGKRHVEGTAGGSSVQEGAAHSPPTATAGTSPNAGTCGTATSLAELYYERLTGEDVAAAEAAARQWFGWEMALSSAGTTPPGLVYVWDGEQYLSKDTLRNTVTDANGRTTTPKPTTGPLRRPNRVAPSQTAGSGTTGSSTAGSGQVAASPSAGVESRGLDGASSSSSGAGGGAGNASHGRINGGTGGRNGGSGGGVGDSGSGSSTDGDMRQDTSSAAVNAGADTSARNSAAKGRSIAAGSSASITPDGNTRTGDRTGGHANVAGGSGGVATNASVAGAGTTSGSTRPAARDNSSISGTLTQAMLECHYVVHGAFLSEHNHLLHPDGIGRLRQHNIPAIAVHGQMDYVCPVGIAHALHRAWPEMELRVVAAAGHSMYDRGILPELVEATDKMRSIVS